VFMGLASPKGSANTGTHTNVFNYILCLYSNVKCISSTKMHEGFFGNLVVFVCKGHKLFL